MSIKRLPQNNTPKFQLKYQPQNPPPKKFCKGEGYGERENFSKSFPSPRIKSYNSKTQLDMRDIWRWAMTRP